MKVGFSDVLDEMALEGQRLATDAERRFTLGFDAFVQRVVGVLDVGRFVRRGDTGDGGEASPSAAKNPGTVIVVPVAG